MFPPGQPPFNPGFPPGHPGQPMMNSGPSVHVGRFPPPMAMQGTPGGPEGGSSDMMTGAQEVMELGTDAEPPVRYAPFLYSIVFTHVCVYMHSCTQSGEAVPSESDQPGITPSTEATSTTSATTAAEGDGEEKEKEEVSTQPVATPAPVPEPTPVKEEPKGPRPTASVPVPGIYVVLYYVPLLAIYTYIHTQYAFMTAVDRWLVAYYF